MWSQAQAQAHVQAQAQAHVQACALAHAQDQIGSGRDRVSAWRQRQWGQTGTCTGTGAIMEQTGRVVCYPKTVCAAIWGTLGGCPVPAPACCRAGASVCNAPAASEIDLSRSRAWSVKNDTSLLCRALATAGLLVATLEFSCMSIS